MILYVIRHGDPDYENDSLTELGIRQAESLGRRLQKSGITHVFSSPNGRARMTAEPICRRLGLQAELEPWMSEDLNDAFSHVGGGWCFYVPCEESKSPENIAYGDRWYDAPPYLNAVDARCRYEDIGRASDTFTARFGLRREGRLYRVTEKSCAHVAAFCHQGTSLAWLSYLLGISPAVFWANFDMTLSGYTVLDFGEADEGTLVAPKCICHSEMSHIYEAALPMVYDGRGNV